MLKISFIDRPDCPAKKVQVFNNRTTKVTLVGRMRLPEAVWLIAIPKHIQKWLNNHQGVDVETTIYNSGFILIAEGLSTCSAEDVFSPVYGERIAEARAKLKLYKFALKFASELYKYYFRLLLGDSKVKYFYSMYKQDCLHDTIQRYSELIKKEYDHLNNLLAMS